MPQFDYTSVPRLKKNAASLVGAASVWRGSTATFTITNYDSFHSWSVTCTKGTVTRTNEVISVAIDAAEPAGFATLTVTRNGIADSVQFEVLANAVAAPTILSPTDGATGLMDGVTLTTSAFATLPADQDTHASTDWQIATDAGFTNIVWQSAANNTDLISITVPTGILAVSTTYYARARHAGTTLGAGAWSATVSFTMAAAYYATGAILGDGSVVAGQQSGYWIVFAPEDSASGYWGCYNFEIGAGANSYSDGYANTQAIVANVSAGNGTYNPDDGKTPNAALLADTANYGGFNDWYLPSGAELMLLYNNRALISGGLPVLTNSYYWSSTEVNSTVARILRFSDGDEAFGNKNTQYLVRACRRVPV